MAAREATSEQITSHPTVVAHLSTLQRETPPTFFHVRHLLVGGHQELRIKGRWLGLAGLS